MVATLAMFAGRSADATHTPQHSPCRVVTPAEITEQTREQVPVVDELMPRGETRCDVIFHTRSMSMLLFTVTSARERAYAANWMVRTAGNFYRERKYPDAECYTEVPERPNRDSKFRTVCTGRAAGGREVVVVVTVDEHLFMMDMDNLRPLAVLAASRL